MAGRVQNLKPWPKGTSGNPGGRPKKRLLDEVLTDLLEAQDSAAAVAIAKALIRKAQHGHERTAQLIAERTQGKSAQKLDVEINADPKLLSDDELQQKLTSLLAELSPSERWV